MMEERVSGSLTGQEEGKTDGKWAAGSKTGGGQVKRPRERPVSATSAQLARDGRGDHRCSKNE